MRIHPLISTVVGERAIRPISVISVVSAIGTALSPALFKVPLVLAMLSPRLPFLVLAAGGTNPVLFVALLGARLSVHFSSPDVVGRGGIKDENSVFC